MTSDYDFDGDRYKTWLWAEGTSQVYRACDIAVIAVPQDQNATTIWNTLSHNLNCFGKLIRLAHLP